MQAMTATTPKLLRLRRLCFEGDRPIWWIIGLGVSLRFLLASINMDAFDPHMEVVQSIAYEHRWPGLKDSWEGFQPKLWYATIAFILRLLPTHHIKDITRIAQCVNVIAGLGTLLIIKKFLAELKYSRETQIVAIGLLALNPMLMGLDATATNDSFSILFSTCTLYFGYRWFTSGKVADFVLTTTGATLAVSTKGNGLVAAIAVLCGFAICLVIPEWRRMRTPMLAAAYLGTVLLACLYLAPYGDFYKQYGSPFVTAMDPDPIQAHFFTYVPSQVGREGARTGFSWFFTFRFLDLVALPQLRGSDYRPFRSSLPTMLYGHWHYLHLRTPKMWINYSPWVTWLGRILVVFGLIPATYFLLGTLKTTGGVVRKFLSRQVDSQLLGRCFLVVAALGYFAFVGIFSYQLRDFAAAKALYIYPGFVALYYLFAEGYEKYRQHLWPSALKLQRVALALLCGLYVADILVVIWDQFHRVPGVRF